MQENIGLLWESAQTEPVATLELVPLSQPIVSSGLGRTNSIWTLAETLRVGDSLTLAYRFHTEGCSRGTIAVALERRHTVPVDAGAPGSPKGTPPDTMLEVVRDAITLSFPGFRSEAASLPALPFSHQLAIIGSNVTLTGVKRPRQIGPRPLDITSPGSVRLSATPLAGVRVDETLAAIFGLKRELELRLTLSRDQLCALELRLLKEADARLFACLGDRRNDFSQIEEFRVLRRQIAEFTRAESKIQLQASIAAREEVNPVLVATIQSILFPEDARDEWDDAEGLFLAGSIPFASSNRPSLIPNPETLDILGFRRRETPPREPGEPAIELGTDEFGRRVSLLRRDAAQHVYVAGSTGVGKSTLLYDMALQDIEAGYGLIVIEPHGDLSTALASFLKGSTAIFADVSDFEHPFGLNLLETTQGPVAVQRNFIANQMINLFQSVLYEGVPEAFGPMFAAYFRNALMLLMTADGANASLADFDRVFADPAYRHDLYSRCDDQIVLRFWKGIAARAGGDASLENIAPYIVSKLTQFTGNPVIRPIITARRSTLNFDAVLNDGVPCIVNLAKGAVGQTDAALLGGIIVVRLFAAAMARANLPLEQRRPVRVYMDEFSSYSTGVLGQMLAECRKFGLELVLANQGLGQIDGRRPGSNIAHAILANVGSTLAFRIGPEDAHRLAEWFAPEISPTALTRLPNHVFASRLLEKGVPQPVSTVRTRSPRG